MPKILFTTPVFHYPPIGGPSLRIWNSVKTLAEPCPLSLYLRIKPEDMGGEEAVRHLKSVCGEVQFSPGTRALPVWWLKAQDFISRVSRKLTGHYLRWRRPALGTEEDFAGVLRAAERFGADVIWLGYGNISYPLLKYLKEHSSIPVVLDTDSVWSRYVLRGLPFAKDKEDEERILEEGRKKEEEEKWGAALADITTAVSEVDAAFYRQFTASPGRVRIFSNVIDLESYGKTEPPADFKTPCLQLAGSFWPDSPMEVGTRWLLDKVMPLVWSKIPGLHLYIIGNGSQEVLKDVNDSRVHVMGRVHSVVPWLSHADISLVPLHFESGTRFKILEAGACRRPVVSTTLGAEGLPVQDGLHLRIADSPEDFANAIQDLLENPDKARRCGQNLFDLVSERCSLKSLKAEAMEILGALEANENKAELKLSQLK